MVWGLFPVDPLSGEDKYYIFTKGVYKVGRKGCDVIICKDKGVSRIHAELVVDEMISMDHPLHMKSDLPSRVLIRDCSKYGTYINKEKVHKFLNKETFLKDGDVVSFGTGTAVYRFCFVPLIFFIYCSESFQVDQLLRDKVSSIGACITYNLSEECTHVLADELMPVKEHLVDAIVSKKPIVLRSWVELVAEKRIELEIPSWSSYIPTLTVEGVSVKVAASGTRAKCLEGFTCLLESINMGNTQSGNSFNNLIPFSKYPYKDFDYGNQDMLESVKEEKRRKQMEAIAEDLFNTEKGRRRGVAGSLHVLLTRG